MALNKVEALLEAIDNLMEAKDDDKKSDDNQEDGFNELPKSKFEINYKDKDELIKGIHYIGNQLFPLKDEKYTKDTDISKSSYTSKTIQGGITNLLYLLTPNDNDTKDAKNKGKKLLVRIYGENTEVLIDREREQKLFYELGVIGVGPKLYALFGNGRVEQWYDNAHALLLHERKYCPKISKALAEFHSLHPKLLKTEQSQSLLWKTIDKWYNIASNVEFKDNNDKQIKYNQLNWENIPKQIDFMKLILPSNKNDDNIDKLFKYIIDQQSQDKKDIVNKQLNSKINRIAFNFMFEYVFTHNDLLGGNILYLQDTQVLIYVYYSLC